MKICFFGDSFVNGYGDDSCLGWVGRVCAAARNAGKDITCYNLGIPGNTSEDILARWHQEATARISKGEDALLVFAFGTNDCAAGEDGRSRLPQNDRLKNTRSIIVDAPKEWPTLMVGPLPLANDAKANKRITDLSRQAGALARAHRLPYLDVFTSMKDNELWQAECAQGDGVHPNGAGYALVADMVSNWDEWQKRVC